MSRRQRKANDRHCKDEADQSEGSGRMCAPVNLPLHRHGQHLPAEDGEKISRHIEIEVGKAKGGIGIMRRQSDWRNGRRRFVVIDESVRVQQRVRERLASGSFVASGLKARQLVTSSGDARHRVNDEIRMTNEFTNLINEIQMMKGSATTNADSLKS